MSNTIHSTGVGMNGLNAATDILQSIGQTLSTATAGLSYKDLLKLMQDTGADKLTFTAAYSAKTATDMTMEEYQSYIHVEISKMPFHPSRPFDEEIINFSDKCWERMKNDHDYEEKMLGIIRDGRQVRDPFFGLGSTGTYWELYFDGGEGCHSHGWSKSFGGTDHAKKMFDDKAANSFWTSRAERAEEQKLAGERYVAQFRQTQAMSIRIAMMRQIQISGESESDITCALDEPPVMSSEDFLLNALGATV